MAHSARAIRLGPWFDDCAGLPNHEALSLLRCRAVRPEIKGENMKYLFAAVLLASTVAGFGAANAAGGCGPGMHRGPYGGCRVNGGALMGAPGAVCGGRAVDRGGPRRGRPACFSLR